MINYEDLVDNPNFITKYVTRGTRDNLFALSLLGHDSPVSITNEEFNFIENFIIEKGLKRGYEIATGCGISALAAGLGFKKTVGKLITMDCYMEEFYNDGTFGNKEKILFTKSDGYKSVKQLIDFYDIKNEVIPKIGISPKDTKNKIKEVFCDVDKNKLDYIFIDGQHTGDAIVDDIKSILDFIDDGTFILFHDIHIYGGIYSFSEITKKYFKKNTKIVVPQPLGFDLGLLDV